METGDFQQTQERRCTETSMREKESVGCLCSSMLHLQCGLHATMGKCGCGSTQHQKLKTLGSSFSNCNFVWLVNGDFVVVSVVS